MFTFPPGQATAKMPFLKNLKDLSSEFKELIHEQDKKEDNNVLSSQSVQPTCKSE